VPHTLTRTTRSFLAGTFVALACCLTLVAAGTADGRVEVKNGVYFQAAKKPKQPQGFVTVNRGKVNSAFGAVIFRKPNGKKCVPQDYDLLESNGRIQIAFAAKQPARPNRKNRFRITNAPQSFQPGLKATVTGKFLSPKRATITINAKVKTCTAKLTLKNAVFTAGG
jgi:hypothetical protein